MVKTSRLYSPYRAIGYVTDGAPFAINRLGEATFITTTTGKAFQVYEHEKLRISLVSPPRIEGGRVVAVVAQGNRTFIATEKRIQVWERVSLKASLSPEPRGRLCAMLLVGDVLMALCDTGLLRVWDARSLSLEGEMELGGDQRLGACLIHPDTYLNKILVGDSSGRLSLWNIRSKKRVHQLQLRQDATGGQLHVPASSAAVTALQQSPAVDVVAVGRGDGVIELVNLKFDQVLFRLRQEGAAVTSLAFRTDSASHDTPMLASGGHDGQIHVWDLKTHRLHSVLPAHEGSVSSLYFFPREPLLLSGSRDNSLKMWIFDGADGTARLHKSREGHTAPPRRIRYYGGNTLASMGSGADATACQILSAGSDRAFRVFNTARDSQSRELSQGPLLKKARRLNVKVEELKLKPIVAFAAVETRARDWANVITCHEEDAQAYVWKFDQRVIGQVVLRQPDWPSNEMASPDVPAHHALCVTVTSCGNYGLVGTRGGVVYLYNMQSGEARGAYPSTRSAVSRPHESVTLDGSKKARPGSVWAAFNAIVGETKKKRPRSEGGEEGEAVAERKPEGHTGPVTGVEVDSINSTVISASLDGTLRFWDFKRHRLLDVVTVGVGVSQLELARDSDLLAAACDDFVVRVYDVTTRKLVRRLSGHSAQVTDMAFSRDGRRLVTASVDASLRVWHLPTGACVDWLVFKRAVTGVSVSPTGEFLCTSHVDSVSLSLWADRSLYGPVALDAPLTCPCVMDDPSTLAETDENGNQQLDGPDLFPTLPVSDTAAAAATASSEAAEDAAASSSGPYSGAAKAEGLITLSMLPRAHWQTLFALELIKQRNKPKEPPKAPPRAPFFLPTLHIDGQVEPTFAAPPPEQLPDKPAEEEDGGFPPLAQAWSDDDDDEEEEAEEGGGDGEEEEEEAKGEAEEEGRGWVVDRAPSTSGASSSLVKKKSAGPGVVAAALNTSQKPTGGSRILSSGKGKGKKGQRVVAKPSRSRLAQLLMAPSHEEEGEAVTEHLLSLSPPQVDLEMQALCLGQEDDDGVQVLARALRYFRGEVRRRRHFEAMQSYLHRFLHIYGPLLLQLPALRQEVTALKEAQAEANRQVKELIQHNACLLGYLTNLHGF